MIVLNLEVFDNNLKIFLLEKNLLNYNLFRCILFLLNYVI